MSEHIIPAHLPKKLTISFPIWGLYATPDAPVYADPYRFMREHRERGFNCVRFDDGAGLSHDLNGKRRGPVSITPCYGTLDRKMRQFLGGTGSVDTMQRLIDMCRAAKEYDTYLILSSWYYLHTYWMADNTLNDELYAIPVHERFMAFAKFLDYILCELEALHLEDRIAFCEVFNEADSMLFAGGYGKDKTITNAELLKFRHDHEKALDYLKARHPEILFAFDTSTPDITAEQILPNMDLLNFHSYYVWDIYSEFQQEGVADPYMIERPLTTEEALATREGKYPSHEDWYERARFYPSLDDKKLPEACRWFEKRFEETYDHWCENMDKGLLNIEKLRRELFPDKPVVMGEGVTYIGRVGLNWEENDPLFIKLLERQQLKHKELGLWGTVVRTCCGPEDNIWTEHPDLLLHLNKMFAE